MRQYQHEDKIWIKIISCTKEESEFYGWYEHRIGEEMEVMIFGTGKTFHSVPTDNPHVFIRVKVTDCVDITRQRKIGNLLKHFKMEE